MKRFSIKDTNGVYPPDAIWIDRKNGTFSIRGAKSTAAKKPEIPMIKRESKDIFRCIHRGNHIGDAKCGGCGGNKFVEVYACEKFTSCVVSRASTDRRIKLCSTCDQRSPCEQIEFSSLNNKYEGKTATIVGRGPTTTSLSDVKFDGPVLFINDAVLLENEIPDTVDSYFIAQDDRTACLLPGIKSVAVLSKGTGIATEVNIGRVDRLGKICWAFKSTKGEDDPLTYDRETLAVARHLYRGSRAPTVGMAIHLAWYMGCTHINFIRCDCLPVPYADDIPNRSDSPIHPSQYPQTKKDQNRVVEVLGMTCEYIGTPVIEGIPAPESDMIIDFTSTETDTPGRMAINAEALESIKQSLSGVILSECNLYLNIDHVPDGVGPEPLVAVASQYFKKVFVNYTGRGDFGAAFRWCLSQPKTEYSMHVELDWVMIESVDLHTLRDVLISTPNAACVNLRAYNFKADDPRICLSPGLWRTDHARVIAERLVDGYNPESQLRRLSGENPEGGKADGFIGVHYPADRNAVMIRDTGRQFLKGTQYRRPANIAFNSYQVT